MNIWLVMIIGGLITFGMRFSLIFLFGKFEIPETMRKALHYVPPAVLSAIIFPELFYHSSQLDVSFGNTHRCHPRGMVLKEYTADHPRRDGGVISTASVDRYLTPFPFARKIAPQ